jgi:hypothetical protein
MNRIVAAITHIAQLESNVELTRCQARLALLVVVDRLPEILDAEEMTALVGAVPLGLHLALHRAGKLDVSRALLDQLHDGVVRAVCAALSRYAEGELRARLRHDLPAILRSDRTSGEFAKASRSIHQRPTVKLPAPVELRPTVRVARAAS